MKPPPNKPSSPQSGIETAGNRTTLLYLGEEECYAEWFECSQCHYDLILKRNNFCPNCGRKIEEIIIEGTEKR